MRILTSAYANIDNLQQAINGAAIYRFVPKPWDLDELCTAMQEALIAERVRREDRLAKPRTRSAVARGDALKMPTSSCLPFWRASSRRR